MTAALNPLYFLLVLNYFLRKDLIMSLIMSRVRKKRWIPMQRHMTTTNKKPIEYWNFLS